MMNKSFLSVTKKIVIGMLLLTIFSALTVGKAATTSGNHLLEVSQSPPTAQSKQIRTYVALALADVANIRDQVRHNQNDHLLDQLLKLNILMGMIKASRPTGEIDALIKFYQEHLSFEDNKQGLADILPLYKALEALPKTKQTELARQQLDRVRANLEKGMQADALTALEEMRRTLDIDGVDFPLQAAEEKLHSVTNLYEENQELPKDSSLLGLETDLLQILDSLT